MISPLSLITPSLSVFVFVPGRPVQEDDPHSSEDHTNPQSNQERWSQTGTSFTSSAPIGVEIVSGKEGGRGRLHEGLDLSSGTYSSSQDQGLTGPTSLLRGLTVAGRADRETLLFPEEGRNNGADTSGAAHLTDSPTSAKERTHPSFQPTRSADSLFHTSGAKNSRNEFQETQSALTRETQSTSNTLDVTDIHNFTVTHPTLESSSSPSVISSAPETTRESGTILSPHDGAVSVPPDEKSLPSWRSHRSADKLNSNLTSSITSDLLQPPTEPPEETSANTNTETKPTASSSSQGPSVAYLSSTTVTDISTTVSHMESASFNANMTTNVSLVSTTSDTKNQSGSSEKSTNTETLHTFTSSLHSQTNSPQSTGSITPTPSANSFSTQQETQTTTESTQSKSEAISSSLDATKVADRTFSFTESSPTPGSALTLRDEVQSRNNESYTLYPTSTTFNGNSPTNAPTSALFLSASEAELSSTNSQRLHTHSTSAGTALSSPTISPFSFVTTQSMANTPLLDQRKMPTTLKTSTVTPTSSHTAQTQNPLPLPSSSDAVTTHKQYQDFSPTQASPLSLTTLRQNADNGEKHDELWKLFQSSTDSQTPTAGSTQQNLSVTTPLVTKNHPTTVQTSVLSSTTSVTPKFYIVPDQPVAIRGNISAFMH